MDVSSRQDFVDFRKFQDFSMHVYLAYFVPIDGHFGQFVRYDFGLEFFFGGLNQNRP